MQQFRNIPPPPKPTSSTGQKRVKRHRPLPPSLAQTPFEGLSDQIHATELKKVEQARIERERVEAEAREKYLRELPERLGAKRSEWAELLMGGSLHRTREEYTSVFREFVLAQVYPGHQIDHGHREGGHIPLAQGVLRGLPRAVRVLKEERDQRFRAYSDHELPWRFLARIREERQGPAASPGRKLLDDLCSQSSYSYQYGERIDVRKVLLSRDEEELNALEQEHHAYDLYTHPAIRLVQPLRLAQAATEVVLTDLKQEARWVHELSSS